MYFTKGGFDKGYVGHGLLGLMLLPKSNCNLDICFDSELICFEKIIFVLALYTHQTLVDQ